MESLMLTIKFVMFYAFGVFVVATLGAAVIAGLVQVIGNLVRSERAALADQQFSIWRHGIMESVESEDDTH